MLELRKGDFLDSGVAHGEMLSQVALCLVPSLWLIALYS